MASSRIFLTFISRAFKELEGCRTLTTNPDMFGFLALFSLAAISSEVNAHGGVLSYKFDNAWYTGYSPYLSPSGQTSIQREWDSYNPITNPTHAQLACNINGAPLGQQLSATVAAGSSVTAFWNPWPHTIGPVLVYMAQCPGPCSTADAASLDWFKIDEAGLITGNLVDGLWAQGQLVSNNNSWTTVIPASLRAGEYMLRHELIAIHTSNIPQFYPNCAQLKVAGEGNAVPNSTVKFPGGYSRSDPGVIIDIYAAENRGQTTYQIPGPPVFRG
uniref:AA9 family lytic polysaccharide monooxygenase n=1 Tax=Moniliophthora roreri TaxID=221103 RepID=A0A0W0FGZ4_MONRR